METVKSVFHEQDNLKRGEGEERGRRGGGGDFKQQSENDRRKGREEEAGREGVDRGGCGRGRVNAHLLVERPSESGHECSSCNSWCDPSKHASDPSSLAYGEDSLY